MSWQHYHMFKFQARSNTDKLVLSQGKPAKRSGVALHRGDGVDSHSGRAAFNAGRHRIHWAHHSRKRTAGGVVWAADPMSGRCSLSPTLRAQDGPWPYPPCPQLPTSQHHSAQAWSRTTVPQEGEAPGNPPSPALSRLICPWVVPRSSPPPSFILHFQTPLMESIPVREF